MKRNEYGSISIRTCFGFWWAIYAVGMHGSVKSNSTTFITWPLDRVIWMKSEIGEYLWITLGSISYIRIIVKMFVLLSHTHAHTISSSILLSSSPACIANLLFSPAALHSLTNAHEWSGPLGFWITALQFVYAVLCTNAVRSVPRKFFVFVIRARLVQHAPHHYHLLVVAFVVATGLCIVFRQWLLFSCTWNRII